MRLRLSQPSLAGVGAGAELGNIDLVLYQREHHSKNRYKDFKNEDFCSNLTQHC